MDEKRELENAPEVLEFAKAYVLQETGKRCPARVDRHDVVQQRQCPACLPRCRWTMAVWVAFGFRLLALPHRGGRFGPTGRPGSHAALGRFQAQPPAHCRVEKPARLDGTTASAPSVAT